MSVFVKESRKTGRVKWFDNKKGYGFLVQDGGGADVFVHHTDIIGKGYKTLNEGESVTFAVIETGKGLKAMKVEQAAQKVI